MAGQAAKYWVGLACAVGVGFSALAADPIPTGLAPIGEPALPLNAPPVPKATPIPLPQTEPPYTVLQPPRPADLPGTAPFRPAAPFEPEVVLPNGARVPLPASAKQIIRFSPRYDVAPNLVREPMEGGFRAIQTGGVIVNVVMLKPDGTQQEIEFASDNVVAWMKGNAPGDPAKPVETQAGGKNSIELYLSGNVVIRTMAGTGMVGATDQVLRAEQIYYDVNRNRAIALSADLEISGGRLPDPVHVRGKEVWRLGQNEWRSFDSGTSASKRPSDPGLTLGARETQLIQEQKVRRNIFGIPYRNFRTGETEFGYERTLTSRDTTINVFDTPVFWYPKLVTDLEEPLGPLNGIGAGNDRIFGFQIYTTWDVYKLIGLRPAPGHSWHLDIDYLSDRGPAGGSRYDYRDPDFFGFGGANTGFLRGYVISDGGQDVLGSFRGTEPPKPTVRGRAQWQHNQDIYEDRDTYVRAMAQVEYLSDKNFLEQYYKQEFDFNPNQETFTYLYGASGNAWGSLLTQGKVHRDWVTETEWLPRVDGALVGQSFLDLISYSARASAGYAQLKPTTEPPPPVLPTDVRVDTGRFNLRQRVDVPFDLGPFRFDPYGVLDLTQYTEDISGNSRGRFYGGGGAKVSLPLSRLYPGAASELFNVRGLYHKVNIGANYYNSHSDTPYTDLPQLDRVFDDAVDQSYRSNRPQQPNMVPGAAGVALGTSPIFDPQQYAIRRLVENRVDTLDSMQVLQLDVRQRLQTKRGFIGAEHTVDWMSLDVSSSIFPDQGDNYGEAWAFLEYNYVWNVGDRVSLLSAGWFDPFEYGARYFNVGANLNRPDGTNFYLSYRHTDPVNSRAVTAGMNYQLSTKYAVNLGTSYDFGFNQALSNNVSFTRTGADATLLFGVTYNALVNNFGVQFAIIPNVAAFATGGRIGGIGGGGFGAGGGR